MNKEESMLEAMTKVRPEMLDEDTLKLFYEIMAVIDERDKYKALYEKETNQNA